MMVKIMNRYLKGICFATFYLLLSVGSVFGASIQINYNGDLPTKGLTTLNKNLSAPGVNNEGWETDHREDILILPFDGLNIPIVYKTEVTYASPDKGYFVFTPLGIRTITSTPVIATNTNNTDETYRFRPTLFVTLCGADLRDSNILDGHGGCDWEKEVSRKISDHFQQLRSSSDAHQFHHMMVDWDSNAIWPAGWR